MTHDFVITGKLNMIRQENLELVAAKIQSWKDSMLGRSNGKALPFVGSANWMTDQSNFSDAIKQETQYIYNRADRKYLSQNENIYEQKMSEDQISRQNNCAIPINLDIKNIENYNCELAHEKQEFSYNISNRPIKNNIIKEHNNSLIINNKLNDKNNFNTTNSLTNLLNASETAAVQIRPSRENSGGKDGSKLILTQPPIQSQSQADSDPRFDQVAIPKASLQTSDGVEAGLRFLYNKSSIIDSKYNHLHLNENNLSTSEQIHTEIVTSLHEKLDQFGKTSAFSPQWTGGSEKLLFNSSQQNANEINYNTKNNSINYESKDQLSKFNNNLNISILNLYNIINKIIRINNENIQNSLPLNKHCRVEE